MHETLGLIDDIRLIEFCVQNRLHLDCVSCKLVIFSSLGIQPPSMDASFLVKRRLHGLVEVKNPDARALHLGSATCLKQYGRLLSLDKQCCTGA
jgi:hypothetical protein